MYSNAPLFVFSAAVRSANAKQLMNLCANMELPFPATQLIYNRTMQHRLDRNSFSLKELIMIPVIGAALGLAGAVGNAATAKTLAESLTALKLKTQAEKKGRDIAESAI